MRKRLLVATVGTVAIGVLLLGLPLAVAVRGVLTTQAFETLQRQAEQVQVLFNQQQLSGTERRDLLHDLAGQFDVRFQVFDRVIRDGSRVGFLLTEDTGEMANEEVDFTDDLDAAFDGELGRAGRDGVLAVSVPLRIAGVPQVLRAIAPDDELRSSLSAAWLSIGGLAITSLGIAGFVGLMVARRIATPLEDLAEAATALGEGDFSARAMASGIPESDQLAAALNITAERLGILVERSKSFGADASHQLRTPLTALRLDLEALQLAGADEALLGAAFSEADRLESTIEELLALADVPMGDEHIQLATLVEERVESWRALAQAEDRRVEVSADPVPLVRGRSAAIGQCLQVLLDNALEHGEGTISVTVTSVESPLVPERGWVRLCVTDEGEGFAEESVPGRGLRLAKSLVQAEGGRIKVQRPSTVCLLLPAMGVDIGRLVQPSLTEGELR